MEADEGTEGSARAQVMARSSSRGSRRPSGGVAAEAEGRTYEYEVAAECKTGCALGAVFGGGRGTGGSCGRGVCS